MAFKKINLVDLIQRARNESVNLLIQSQDPEIYLVEADVRRCARCCDNRQWSATHDPKFGRDEASAGWD